MWQQVHSYLRKWQWLTKNPSNCRSFITKPPRLLLVKIMKFLHQVAPPRCSAASVPAHVCPAAPVSSGAGSQTSFKKLWLERCTQATGFPDLTRFLDGSLMFLVSTDPSNVRMLRWTLPIIFFIPQRPPLKWMPSRFASGSGRPCRASSILSSPHCKSCLKLPESAAGTMRPHQVERKRGTKLNVVGILALFIGKTIHSGMGGGGSRPGWIEYVQTICNLANWCQTRDFNQMSPVFRSLSRLAAITTSHGITHAQRLFEFSGLRVWKAIYIYIVLYIYIYKDADTNT